MTVKKFTWRLKLVESMKSCKTRWESLMRYPTRRWEKNFWKKGWWMDLINQIWGSNRMLNIVLLFKLSHYFIEASHLWPKAIKKWIFLQELFTFLGRGKNFFLFKAWPLNYWRISCSPNNFLWCFCEFHDNKMPWNQVWKNILSQLIMLLLFQWTTWKFKTRNL